MQVRRGSTTVFDHYCRQTVDPPTAAVSVVVYTNTGETLATAVPTRDTASQTISSGLHGGDTLTVTTAAAFVVGKKYRVTDTAGRYIDALLLSKTATTLVLNVNLPWTATAGLVFSTRLYATIVWPDVTYRSCRAVWGYVSGSQAKEETDTFDVVRTPFVLNLDFQDVADCERMFVDSSSDVPSRYIDQAISDMDGWLRGEQIFPDLVIDRRLLEQAAVWRVLELRHLRNAELKAVFDTEKEKCLNQFKTSKSWYNAEDDLKQALNPADNEPPVKYLRVG